MILDGKQNSFEIREKIKNEIEVVFKNTDKRPGLAVIIVGENSASKVYVNSKIKSCRELGMKSELYSVSEEVDESEIVNLINQLNEDDNIDGILVQLPLPAKFREANIIEAISPKKDVDCFTHENIGKLFLNEKTSLKPCTPQGIVELLKKYDIEFLGKRVVIIGRSNIVGKPMALMFINEGATVTVCNSHTKNLINITREADILVSAVGKPKFITEDMIKKDAIIVDVGINRVEGKLVGDVDFENVNSKASYITPVPGGVGPMTIAMLMKNTFEAFKNNRG
ncbi:MAG: bifunctional methylenetetrahydrofolate dehydrogenase/methenyltetrahydrofolate cyclohydrolase FolD [Fusobacteriaceae bacterium]